MQAELLLGARRDQPDGLAPEARQRRRNRRRQAHADAPQADLGDLQRRRQQVRLDLQAARADALERHGLERALEAVPLKRIGARRLKIETHLLAPALKIAEIGLRRVGVRLPPPIPPSLARLWRQPIRLVSTRAEQQLGLHWTSLQQGLAATVAAART